MKKLTLEEVAKLAGVSRATVSRVVNDPEGVSPEYRERVQRVIAETGFLPNQAARTLASRRSNILGLIIPTATPSIFSDPYVPALIKGISHACNLNDYTLTLFLFHSQEEQQQVFQRALGTGLLDGLIVAADKLSNPLVPQLIARQIPAIYVGRPPDASQTSFVDVDNVAGAYMAINHLLRMGRQRVATITGPLHSTAAVDRRDGYLKALRDYGLPVDASLILEGNFDHNSGYHAMRSLLNLPIPPDGLFAASDTMAIGALEAIRESGRHIPEDIAVIGFDDLTLAAAARPPLTTVRQPVLKTGMVAVETIIDLLRNGNEPPRHILLSTELIIRETCGAIYDA